MLAVVLAFGLGSLAGHKVPWLVGLVAVGFGVLGFVDDRRSLPSIFRLIAQVAVGAAALAAFAGGWWIPIGILTLLVFVNVVNFMDGINGITSLNAGFWGITACILGTSYGLPQLLAIGAATAGSALGFLPWNAPIARIFLGDSGSYFFGALIALGCLVGAREGVPLTLLIAPMGLYLADSGTTLVKRFVRGQPLLQAHRDHVYQRLVFQGGPSHIAVSGLTTVLAGIITASWAFRSAWFGVMVTTAIVVAYLLLPRFMRLIAVQPVAFRLVQGK